VKCEKKKKKESGEKAKIYQQLPGKTTLTIGYSKTGQGRKLQRGGREIEERTRNEQEERHMPRLNRGRKIQLNRSIQDTIVEKTAGQRGPKKEKRTA